MKSFERHDLTNKNLTEQKEEIEYKCNADD